MKRIFLTGASSGIGLAIAQSLIARGDQVWGTSRNLIRLEHLPGVHPVRLDLSDPRSIDEAFKSALSQSNYFDVAINNAGSGHFGAAEHLSQAEIESQFQILVFGQLQLTRLAIAAMRARGHGLIINVTSLASRLPVPFMAAYNAAKAALAAYTMSLQLELPDSKVRIVDLQPADISTAFNDAVPKNVDHDALYHDRVAKTWAAVDRNMKNAPAPELVAKHVLRLIDSTSPPPRITVGDAFQSKVAPLIFRFLPQRVRVWGLKQYYGI
ncbi:MAG: SDR family NAD(P)-dependent oxidoreductase [Verrucomicrobia bacterium]|nr:SDR family NAD(P)-dependent oxidoreductase [Verrucomicrobiota bacterium]